jgi:RNA-binding protein
VLTSKQRSYLSALSNKLEPVAALGRAGLSEAVVKHARTELERHELIKLRFTDYKETREDFARELAEKTGAELVRVIGNVAVFYRASPDPDKRGITLPE